MHAPVIFKYQKDQIKSNREKVKTPFPHYKFMEFFPDAQWQLTPQFVFGCGRISNLSEILWLSSSSIPAKLQEIPSKMKALEWLQHFPIHIQLIWGDHGHCDKQMIANQCQKIAAHIDSRSCTY